MLISQNKKNLEINYYWRGRTYFKLTNYIKALLDFNLAIQLKANDGIYYFWRGRTYFKLGNLREAIADFTRSIRLQSGNIEH